MLGLERAPRVENTGVPAATWWARFEVWFLRCCGVALLLTGTAKILSLASFKSCSDRDPVFVFLSTCGFLLVGGVIEVLASCYLWFGKSAIRRQMLVILFGVNFFLYRVVLWWKAPGQSCSCAGPLLEKVPELSGALKLMVVVFIVGGVFFALWPALAAAYGRWSRNIRSLAFWGGALLLVLLVLPPLQVVYVAAVNPSKTMPMQLEQWRGTSVQPIIWRNLHEIAPEFVRGVVVAEDRRFFEHSGFDWVRNREAIGDWLAKGKTPRGVSTISQQCARSLFLWHGRSWGKKAAEAYYTYWMETILPKRRILELYVNVIELGPGVYGIEAAAQHHFARSADTLSPQQATLLVTIMPSPKRWDPQKHELQLRDRQQAVLAAVQRLRLPHEAGATRSANR